MTEFVKFVCGGRTRGAQVPVPYSLQDLVQAAQGLFKGDLRVLSALDPDGDMIEVSSDAELAYVRATQKTAVLKLNFELVPSTGEASDRPQSEISQMKLAFLLNRDMDNVHKNGGCLALPRYCQPFAYHYDPLRKVIWALFTDWPRKVQLCRVPDSFSPSQTKAIIQTAHFLVVPGQNNTLACVRFSTHEWTYIDDIYAAACTKLDQDEIVVLRLTRTHIMVSTLHLRENGGPSDYVFLHPHVFIDRVITSGNKSPVASYGLVSEPDSNLLYVGESDGQFLSLTRVTYATGETLHCTLLSVPFQYQVETFGFLSNALLACVFAPRAKEGKGQEEQEEQEKETRVTITELATNKDIYADVSPVKVFFNSHHVFRFNSCGNSMQELKVVDNVTDWTPDSMFQSYF